MFNAITHKYDDYIMMIILSFLNIKAAIYFHVQ